jgi:hypothetical protein
MIIVANSLQLALIRPKPLAKNLPSTNLTIKNGEIMKPINISETK